MENQNKYGLARNIPAEVLRLVRQRCKFGCVICRSGFFTYEHIDPQFADALVHNPDDICCLCGSCHDLVTRGRMSKAKVRAAYQSIQRQSSAQTIRPRGPIDFYDGVAHLAVGGIEYPPAVQTVVRYHGDDLIRIFPGSPLVPGSISALFTDDQGVETLRLVRNEWIGSIDAWDIETVGQRLTVRRKAGQIALSLKFQPPGRVLLERLDMRYADAHILVTPKAFAVGRYVSSDRVFWCTARALVARGNPGSSVIEFVAPEEIERRDRQFSGVGQSLATDDRSVVMHSNVGLTYKALGIVIASMCNGFSVQEFAIGVQSLAFMRRAAARNPFRFGPYVSHSRDEPFPVDDVPSSSAVVSFS